VSDRFDGRVPNDVETLLTLPGVGPYTARAVCAFAFGQRQPVVDTNVRRVISRSSMAKRPPRRRRHATWPRSTPFCPTTSGRRGSRPR
jgi:A/G-specific adenine glycosylase